MAEKVTKNLSPKQLKTIEALLTNGSVDSAEDKGEFKTK